MLNIKEKLVELIKEGNGGYDFASVELIACHLIANGITFQKWNHASITPKDGLYIVKLKNGNKLPARYNCGNWIMCEGYKNITNDVVEWKEVE